MTQQHPISPPPDLVRKWATWRNAVDEESFWRRIATEAAQWGADQELEASCEWLEDNPNGWVAFNATEFAAKLRAARRPKPPNLAEQGLKLLEPPNGPVMLGTPEYRLTEFQAQILRAALKRLNELDQQATP